nr:MAG TPA: hypothetical protein [Caudoviricetes sp.]
MHVNNIFLILCDFIDCLKIFVAFLRIVLYYVNKGESEVIT